MDEYQLKNFLKFAPARMGLTQKKHLFIHIPKNGGMTIRKAPQLRKKKVVATRNHLKSKEYADNLLATMNSTGDHHGYEHARLRDVNIWVRKSTIPFAIVRNPWARVVSRFTFSMQAVERDSSVSDYSANTFEAFLEERHEWGNREFFWHRAIRGWYPQFDHVCDENNEIAVNVLRLENFADEFSNYFGISEEIRRRNKTKRKVEDYKSFYNDKTIQVVADWYAKDIDVFGFDFETMATKNTYFS
jgi:Sulfotransferase family